MGDWVPRKHSMIIEIAAHRSLRARRKKQSAVTERSAPTATECNLKLDVCTPSLLRSIDPNTIRASDPIVIEQATGRLQQCVLLPLRFKRFLGSWPAVVLRLILLANAYYTVGVAYIERSKWRYVRSRIWVHAAARGCERGVK